MGGKHCQTFVPLMRQSALAILRSHARGLSVQSGAV